jgi:P-type Mg2+ transporter
MGMADTATMASPRPGSPPGVRFWAVDLSDVLTAVGSTSQGLSELEASRRLARDGPNLIGMPRRHRGVRLFAAQFTSPIILILVAATVLSALLGDMTDGSIILAIILASGVLGFWQEHTAGIAVDGLLDRVRVEVEALRDGREVSVPATNIVVGDVVVLRAGDIVPADCRILDSRSLLVDEAALTGESYPAEKAPGTVPTAAPLSARANAVFFGTHIASGEGTAVVMRREPGARVRWPPKSAWTSATS